MVESTLPSSPPALPGSLPVASTDRIASLDILRGLALFGILLINITSFSLVFAATGNPFYAGELSSLDFGAWWLNHNLVEGRAISVFGILFGAGIILSTEQKDRFRLPVAAHFYRRYGILAGIGLIHAYFVWFGDILFPYALAAFLVFLMRKFSPKILMPLGVLLVTIGIAIYSTFYSFSFFKLDDFTWPSSEEVAKEIATVRGPWLGWFIRNAIMAASMHFAAIPMGLGAFCAGLMLIGIGLYKTQFFQGGWSVRSYLLVSLGIALGALMTTTPEQVLLRSQHQLPYYRVFIGELGPTVMALGYLALTILLLRKERIARLLSLFAPAGRMALTLYLMQSIVCGLVFSGYGLGKFETMSQFPLWIFCLVFYLVQILFAHLWLKRYSFGPLEWAWRRLSYGKLK